LILIGVHRSCGEVNYDCEFVALAQHLDVPLVTADKKILREFPAIAKSLDAYGKRKGTD
jgi:predicted nucleic acid-binding protein